MTNMQQYKGFSSLAIHQSQHSFSESSHISPIYATSTFSFDSADEGMERFKNEDKEKVYSRWGNPGFKVAEEVIAAMEAYNLTDENGNPLKLKALLHASGQAAMTTMFMSNLKAGDAVLTHYSLYGGTHELLTKVLSDFGVEIIIMDMHNLELVGKTITGNKTIKMLHLETPANPTIRCVDIEALTKIAKQNNLLVTVDNTFATPYLQQPFKYGVDFVFHSTTKFLNGHGTSIGGVLVGKDISFMKTKAWKWHVLLGGNSNPFDAYLLTQGMKTLELRMDKHCSNAMKVAKFLNTHPAIEKVNYPGLDSHPDYAIAKKQMKHPGAVMSFEVKGGFEAGKKFIDNLTMCVRAVSLGTVDTLISHPASMTHFGLTKEEREQFDITDGLIRMSVGIENVEDIINDLNNSLV